MSPSGGGRLRRATLRMFGVMHARGFHPAVFVGLVMMPAVVAVGVATDRAGAPTAHDVGVAMDLRGTLSGAPVTGPGEPNERGGR